MNPDRLEMVCLQATWLKRHPVQSTQLADKDKVALPSGGTVILRSAEGIGGNHHRVVTELPLNDNTDTWYVFASHVTIKPVAWAVPQPIVRNPHEIFTAEDREILRKAIATLEKLLAL